MAQTSEVATEVVEKVIFSFMTEEEVRKLSVVKITNPVLLDSVNRPTPGGLYDPAMGPLDEKSNCKTCGLRPFHCPGHCGHIELISPVYNPLMFNKLFNLLKIACCICFHFRAKHEVVARFVSQLELIAKGDVIGARMLDDLPYEGTSGAAAEADSSEHEGSERSYVSCGTTVYNGTEDCLENNRRPSDSFQFTEAMSVLNKFMKLKTPLKCEKCMANNPRIRKATFGWLQMKRSKADRWAHNMKRGKFQDRHISEVVNAMDSSWENNLNPGENDSSVGASVEAEDPLCQGDISKTLLSGPLLPSEVKEFVKRLWKNEAPICSFIRDILFKEFNVSSRTAGDTMFFLGSILVPPIKFRPAAKGGDPTMEQVMEHAHTLLLGKVLQSNIALINAHNGAKSSLVKHWMELQQCINVLYDSKTAGQAKKDAISGICQVLEKKEGIFRQKMMGKRVNFACRSVISPDPYLAVNEIGIPPNFALVLTYPERVTSWNVSELRNAIVNGPEVHPGAISYTDKVSTVKLPSDNKKMRIAISRKLPSSRGLVTQSGRNSDYEFEGKTVYRHLRDGDIVLVNRQPTLHKPSIMAHVVRVLKGEKTLRMHYANCSSYNADFDGDEINVHLPQDEISRAEAYNIVNANEQYIVPTRGDTVRGLIQDHIVGAVLLTLKDTFLTLDEFNQLLYGSGMFATNPGSFSDNQSRKISIIDSEGTMQHVLPAVWKPKPLWTGKQVITALLNHLTRGCEPFSLEKEMKIPEKYFHGVSKSVHSSKDKHKYSENQPKNQQIMKISESSLVIWKNEVVQGVIDKAQFGQFGLVHTVQELYGSESAGLLLSALSRLFTIFLQFHGFTCGVDDLLILPDKDLKRKEILDQDGGKEVHSKFVNCDPEIGPMQLQLELEKMISSNREAATSSLDLHMRRKFKEQQEKISKQLLLTELLKPFPKNCISLMTISGAKGGTVNFQQISSFLGQQDLEGKRVPRMVSGKTLPCFPPWDFTSRAGGYITDRFLSGLRPQEYYFHCMAGREGLVDTAVKTSRSGYLQRSLLKNLESLKVCYDYSVRDGDGSIVQFKYGEDGVDVHRTSFLNNFKALADNVETLRQKFQQEHEFNGYIEELPVGLQEDAEEFFKNLKNSVKVSNVVNQVDFMKLVKQKYLSSLAPSGEPVGVIAAQSIGEPSTQMTLNTFHLAGHGEMNVTLGIPRLQEILMTASINIRTPVLTCPFLHLKSKNDANSLLEKMKRITVADIVESIEAHILPFSVHCNQMARIHKLFITFKVHNAVSQKDCKKTLTTTFLRELENAIKNHIRLLGEISGIKTSEDSKELETDEEGSSSASHGDGEKDKDKDKDRDGDDDGDDDDDEFEDKGEDLGSDLQKMKQQATDDMDYEDGSEDNNSDQESPSEFGEEMQEDSDHLHDEDDGTVEDDELLKDADNDDDDDEEMVEPKSATKTSKPVSKKPKKSWWAQLRLKDDDRRIFVDIIRRRTLEVHFKFAPGEPHLLLDQVAQKVAQKVDIEGSGKIRECRMVEYDATEKTVKWDEKKTKEHKENKRNGLRYWALKAAGVDFDALWEMQDELDISRIYSNSVSAVLNTYGVEAARRTILNEVKSVFEAYGVKVDYRHLSLIADYMTHTGGYRSMSRGGGIAESLAPLAKMSFETASKFIVEAACHTMADDLETPSSRICLGLPVKLGTGSFDIMQNLDI